MKKPPPGITRDGNPCTCPCHTTRRAMLHAIACCSPAPARGEVVSLAYAMNFDDQQEALLALRESRQWVQRAYDEAEAQHDTYGDTYGDPGLYEVMQETGKLMARIDALLVPNLVITPSEPA